MKFIHTLLLLLALVTAGQAFAGERPIDHNSMMVEGGFVLTNYSGDAYGKGYTIIELATSTGLFVVDHLYVGVSAGLYDASYESLNDNYLIGPEVGLYLDPAPSRPHRKGSFYPYVRAFYMIGGVSEYIGESQTRYGGRVGTVAMLSRSIGLDLVLQYSRDKVKELTGYHYSYEYPGGMEIPGGDVSGTTLTFGFGVTGFIF
ncbi:hypothetical protein KQH51_01160 [bacterium]|nr:hypothetical protein [bacterium]MCB2201533.1 hypothetical protein [bacterium]